MKTISLALIVSGLTACGITSNPKNVSLVNDAQWESVSGEDLAVVAIYAKSSGAYSSHDLEYVCAGTLIAPKLVLTAAQCVYYASQEYYVMKGSDLKDPAKRSAPILARELHFDRKFDNDDLNAGHDVALLVLGEALTDVQPMAYLQSPISSAMRGRDVRLLGYGDLKDSSSKGQGLKRSILGKLEGSNDLFVNLGGLSQEVCKGDTGGPVLMRIDGVETVIGVNTLNKKGCLKRLKANRVDPYIQDVIAPILQSSLEPAIALKPAANSCKFTVSCSDHPLADHGSEAKVQYACDSSYSKFETIGPFAWNLYAQDCARLAGALDGVVLPRAQTSVTAPLVERGLMAKSSSHHLIDQRGISRKECLDKLGRKEFTIILAL